MWPWVNKVIKSGHYSLGTLGNLLNVTCLCVLQSVSHVAIVQICAIPDQFISLGQRGLIYLTTKESFGAGNVGSVFELQRNQILPTQKALRKSVKREISIWLKGFSFLFFTGGGADAIACYTVFSVSPKLIQLEKSRRILFAADSFESFCGTPQLMTAFSQVRAWPVRLVFCLAYPQWNSFAPYIKKLVVILKSSPISHFDH